MKIDHLARVALPVVFALSLPVTPVPAQEPLPTEEKEEEQSAEPASPPAMEPSALELEPGPASEPITLPDFDVPVFDDPEDRPELDYLPGWIEESAPADAALSEQAQRDAETLELLLAPRAKVVEPDERSPADRSSHQARGTGGLLLLDDENLQEATVVFEVDDYLRSMSTALSAFSLQALLANFTLFSNLAELYETGEFEPDRALKIVDSHLNLIRTSREQTVRLYQLEMAADQAGAGTGAGDSAAKSLLGVLDALETQGQALREWILTQGYTVPRSYLEAENAARKAIGAFVTRDQP